jgi:hypothetical protein
MKYILTVLAAAITLSACCTTKCETKPGGKAVATDSCCKAGGTCKH